MKAMQESVRIDIIGFLSQKFPHNVFLQYLYSWGDLAYALLVVFLISLCAYAAARKPQRIPGRLQTIAELIVGGLDDFVCGMLGSQGRKLTPFIGTLFIYILSMNLLGLIPGLRSATADLSTTFGLALCVFVYVHFLAIKKLGFFGYVDHLLGKPRGALAATVIFPLFLLCLHIITELIKPVTLSLRLRSNIMADDLLLSSLSGFGIKALPLLLFCTALVIITAIVQAAVFSLLSTVYFAIFLTEE
jgi:F-type H+-transporting ATPase subunit a